MLRVVCSRDAAAGSLATPTRLLSTDESVNCCRGGCVADGWLAVDRLGCWNEFCEPAVAWGLLRKSLLELVAPEFDEFDGKAPAWFEKLLDGRGAESVGRCAGLLPPKPADGDGGVLAKGSEFRGGDWVDDELDGKFDEGWEDDSGRVEPGMVEPGSVACDWLLGGVFCERGGSEFELDGSCDDGNWDDGNCDDEGCRRSFDVDVGCDGRGAACDDDGRDVPAGGVEGLR